MTQADWAEATARRLLAKPLPRRWAHTRGVAAAARTLAPVLGADGDLLTAAAWLHDIGYAPEIAATGFHPLDGARHLRDAEGASGMLCRLVARHSCAVNEAAERGLARDLTAEFRPARRDLADALTYCDMTTSPDGQRLPVRQRLAEIRARYGPDDLVSRVITRSAPELTGAVHRVTGRLAACSPEAAAASPDLVGVAGAVA
jgi:HD domain